MRSLRNSVGGARVVSRHDIVVGMTVGVNMAIVWVSCLNRWLGAILEYLCTCHAPCDFFVQSPLIMMDALYPPVWNNLLPPLFRSTSSIILPLPSKFAILAAPLEYCDASLVAEAGGDFEVGFEAVFTITKKFKTMRVNVNSSENEVNKTAVGVSRYSWIN